MKVTSIGMTPMKCTRFHSLKSTFLQYEGIIGDRDFLILDKFGKPLSSGKHRFFLGVSVSFDQLTEHLSVTFPDGTNITKKCFFDTKVTEIDFPGIKNIKVCKLLGEWDQLFSKYSGLSVSIVRSFNPNGGIDILPITLYTTASLDLLEKKLETRIDPRRFRANLEIHSTIAHIEDTWNGKHISIGESVLKVHTSVPRCVVTQLNPHNGINDLRTIPALLEYREKVKLPNNVLPDYETPGFASYAEVITPGQVSIGDSVALLD